MITIEIISELKTKSVMTKRGPFTIKYHEADLLKPGCRPRPFEMSPPNDAVYEPGLYTISDESFSTNQYDRLILDSYYKLIPFGDSTE